MAGAAGANESHRCARRLHGALHALNKGKIGLQGSGSARGATTDGESAEKGVGRCERCRPSLIRLTLWRWCDLSVRDDGKHVVQ